jgi:hypothetical protein
MVSCASGNEFVECAQVAIVVPPVAGRPAPTQILMIADISPPGYFKI